MIYCAGNCFGLNLSIKSTTYKLQKYYNIHFTNTGYLLPCWFLGNLLSSIFKEMTKFQKSRDVKVESNNLSAKICQQFKQFSRKMLKSSKPVNCDNDNGEKFTVLLAKHPKFKTVALQKCRDVQNCNCEMPKSSHRLNCKTPKVLPNPTAKMLKSSRHFTAKVPKSC